MVVQQGRGGAPNYSGVGSSPVGRGDASLTSQPPAWALHTGLAGSWQKGDPEQPHGLSSWPPVSVSMCPLPCSMCVPDIKQQHQTMYNIKQQNENIMTGQERNPERNEKALYLIPLIALSLLCIFSLHQPLQITTLLCLTGQPQRAARDWYNLSLFYAVKLSPNLGALLPREVGPVEDIGDHN